MREKINELIKGKEYLICDKLYQKSVEEVEKILSMLQWDNPKYQGLLTSTIWKSNSTEVEKILNMPQLKEEKYEHLLKPSIFVVSSKNILANIELFEKYKIDKYITINALRRNPNKQEVLLKYLVKNNIPLLEEDRKGGVKLNRILSASTTTLKNKYHINLNKIEKEEDNDGPSLDD